MYIYTHTYGMLACVYMYLYVKVIHVWLCMEMCMEVIIEVVIVFLFVLYFILGAGDRIPL